MAQNGREREGWELGFTNRRDKTGVDSAGLSIIWMQEESPSMALVNDHILSLSLVTFTVYILLVFKCVERKKNIHAANNECITVKLNSRSLNI